MPYSSTTFSNPQQLAPIDQGSHFGLQYRTSVFASTSSRMERMEPEAQIRLAWDHSGCTCWHRTLITMIGEGPMSAILDVTNARPAVAVPCHVSKWKSWRLQLLINTSAVQRAPEDLSRLSQSFRWWPCRPSLRLKPFEFIPLAHCLRHHPYRTELVPVFGSATMNSLVLQQVSDGQLPCLHLRRPAFLPFRLPVRQAARGAAERGGHQHHHLQRLFGLGGAGGHRPRGHGATGPRGHVGGLAGSLTPLTETQTKRIGKSNSIFLFFPYELSKCA